MHKNTRIWAIRHPVHPFRSGYRTAKRYGKTPYGTSSVLHIPSTTPIYDTFRSPKRIRNARNGMCRYFIGNGTCPCILTGGRFGYGVVVRLHTDRDSLSGETHLPGPTVAVEKSRGFVRIRFPAAGGRRLRQPGRTFIGRSFSGPVFLHRISLPGWLRQSGRPGTV